MSTGRQNRRFNRIEIPGPDSPYSLVSGEHIYLPRRGAAEYGSTEFKGFIKCKLAHGLGYSVLIPDFIFLGEDGRHWIQPLSYHAPLLGKLDEYIECVMTVDISCAQMVRLRFKNSDFVQKFQDGSELYSCSIVGPDDLETYTTGESELRSGNRTGPLAAFDSLCD
jgi:hypothetical protein